MVSRRNFIPLETRTERDFRAKDDLIIFLQNLQAGICKGNETGRQGAELLIRLPARMEAGDPEEKQTRKKQEHAW